MNKLVNRIERRVWGNQGYCGSPLSNVCLRAMRTVLALGRDLVYGQLNLRAMSLVYTTLLSIVPLLALSFSILKAFGVYNQMQPILLNFLSPLGEMGEEVTRNIVGYIDKVKVGVLGTLGLALLVYTSVSLVQKIEESFNYIWHIPRPRSFGDRFSRYFSVLMVGPILVFSALGITASVMNIELIQELLAIDVLGYSIRIISRLMPYLLIIAAFTFAYIFIPNTRVRFVPALIGGVAAGVAWQTAGWIFASFVVSSNNYAAIYSSMAILILFMIWLYLSWLILLFGANVAFYVQHPEYLYARSGEPRLSNRMRERLAFAVMSLIAEKFMTGQSMPSLADLRNQLGVPHHALQKTLDELVQRQFLVESAGQTLTYVPARDPGLITVAEMFESVRSVGEERFLTPSDLKVTAKVDELLSEAQSIVDLSIGRTTLRELVSGKVESKFAVERRSKDTDLAN